MRGSMNGLAGHAIVRVVVVVCIGAVLRVVAANRRESVQVSNLSTTSVQLSVNEPRR